MRLKPLSQWICRTWCTKGKHPNSGLWCPNLIYGYPSICRGKQTMVTTTTDHGTMSGKRYRLQLIKWEVKEVQQCRSVGINDLTNRGVGHGERWFRTWLAISIRFQSRNFRLAAFCEEFWRRENSRILKLDSQGNQKRCTLAVGKVSGCLIFPITLLQHDAIENGARPPPASLWE